LSRFADFAGRAAIRCLALGALAWVALWALALPAGERLVAGLSRVDFALEPAFTDLAAGDRAGSFLTLLASGVLMRNLPRFGDRSLVNQRKKRARKLSTAVRVNQRKIRVCGLLKSIRPTSKNKEFLRKTLEAALIGVLL
jgi:hypothetical protein